MKFNYIDNKVASMSPKQALMSNKDYFNDLVRIAKGGVKR
jgi:hypothetical protein